MANKALVNLKGEEMNLRVIDLFMQSYSSLEAVSSLKVILKFLGLRQAVSFIIYSLVFGVTHTISKSQFSSFAFATSSSILSLEFEKVILKVL